MGLEARGGFVFNAVLFRHGGPHKVHFQCDSNLCTAPRTPDPDPPGHGAPEREPLPPDPPPGAAGRASGAIERGDRRGRTCGAMPRGREARRDGRLELATKTKRNGTSEGAESKTARA